MNHSVKPTPTVLCILDGWGHREETSHNAIAAAHTPHWDALLRDYPHGLINASEAQVGLPAGQMGNSEVGHMNIGAGRVVMQDLPRIDAAIADGSLNSNAALNLFITKIKAAGGTCHLMGLLSDGGVHAHQDHIVALATIVAASGVPVVIHAFLDGRDTAPRSAREYLSQVEAAIAGKPNIRVATLCGRYYAMDRDARWDRVQKAYELLVNGKATHASSSEEAIAASYANDISDEFVMPCMIGDYTGMHDGDGVLMANFRADRAREILTALLDESFAGFTKEKQLTFSAAAGMVEYSSALAPYITPLFLPESLDNILGEVIAAHGMKQLRIAETEKYAHVTFFMSGGREEAFAGEERILIPSPDVATYDLKPEMSAFELTDQLVRAITSQAYDLIIVNYANTDMVGHSGNLSAAVKAVEAVDTCLGRLHDAINQTGGAMIISADHGNAEQMQNSSTGQPHTAHTLNLVPIVCVGPMFKDQQFEIPQGALADLAPTILDIMQIAQPPEMTGHSLIQSQTKTKAANA